jgi:DNA mismatch endonuclease, patch repair protein
LLGQDRESEHFQYGMFSCMQRKVPSFTGLRPASEAASQVKRKNRRSDTLHELILRRELWRLGLRFRKNVNSLPGKPDVVFPSAKVAVFCDGDFWHGRDWESRQEKLSRGTNASYWLAKIASNIERDARNTALLKKDGWRVIRLWETDVKRDPVAAAVRIKKAVDARLRRGMIGHINTKPKRS